MSKRSFRSALDEADRIIAGASLPKDADERIRRRLKEQQARVRAARMRVRSAVGACALAAGCVVLILLRRPASIRQEPRQLGGLGMVHATADLQTRVGPDQLVEIEKGTCTLVDRMRGTAWIVAAPASVRREEQGIRVVRGRVEVRAEKRTPQGGPALVFVSHGTIQVMGTRFTIEQRPDSGRVTLHEGAILFRSPLSRDVVLRPGESLDWPLSIGAPPSRRGIPRAVAPPSVPPERRADPAPSRTEPFNAKETLDRISVLRTRGLYEECASELAKALSLELAPSTRERLSFELGSILTYQLADPSRACTHWIEHRRRHRTGRYDAEIQQTAEHLKCSPAP